MVFLLLGLFGCSVPPSNLGSSQAPSGVASSLLLNTSSSSLTAGSCSSAITVYATDNTGVYNAVFADTSVSIFTTGSATLYSDSACTTLASTVTILNLQFSAKFYLKDSVSETVQVSAVSSGLTSASLNVNIRAASLTTLVMSGPTQPVATKCNGPYKLKTSDAFGNAVSLNSAVTAALSGNGGGAFYSNGSCTVASNNVYIAADTTSTNFFFKDSTAENLTLNAHIAGITDGTLALTGVGSTPTHVDIAGTTNQTAGACSTAFGITLQDGGNNISLSTGVSTISLSATGAGHFYSDAACTSQITSTTIADGATTATVYFKDNTAESTTLSAAKSGLTTGTIAISNSAAVPSKLVLTGGAASLVAGACSQVYTVTSQDSYSNAANVSSDTTVTLSGEGSGQYYTDATCTTPTGTVTILNGTSATSFYFRDITTEALTLSAAATGLTTSTKALTVTPATISLFTVTGFASPVVAGTSGSLVITAYDTLGNVMTTYTGTIHFTSDDTLAVLPTNYTFTLGDAGTHTFTNAFKLKKTGSHYLKANDTVTTTVVGQQSNITVNPAAIGSFTVSGATSPIAAGVTTAATVSALDIYGNAKTDYTGTVGFTSNDMAATLPANYPFVLGDNGTHTFTNAFSFQLTGNRYIRATDQTTTSATGQQSNITVNPAALAYFTVSGVPASTTVGTVNGVVVTAYDTYSNIKRDYTGTVVFTSTDPSATLPSNYTFVSADQGTKNFTSTVTFRTMGSQNITASDLSNSTLSGEQFGISVNAGTPSKLSLSGPTATTNIACSSIFTVTTQDTYGNVTDVSSDLTVSLSGKGSGAFYSNSNCTTPISTVTITNGTNGSYFYFKDSSSENLVLNASATGYTMGSSALNVGNPALVVSGPTFVAPSTCSAAFKVTISDGEPASVNAPSSYVVDLIAGGSGQIFSDPGCTTGTTTTTINSGTSSSTFYLYDTASEAVTVTASHASASSGQITTNVTSSAATYTLSSGSTHSCFAINGQLKCTGDNTYGQLGDGTTTKSFSLVTVATLPSTVTSVSAGNNTTCAVAGGAAYCWGRGTSGQLGNSFSVNSSTAVQVTGLTSAVTQIATGDTHSCAVVSGGVKCWGSNSRGQLGNSSTTASSSPVTAIAASSGVSKVAVGTNFSCAYFAAGTVSCWGANDANQVGDGTTTDRTGPVQIISSGATDVALGSGHGCAIVSSVIRCWGQDSNNYPSTPTDLVNYVNTPVALASSPTANFTCAVDSLGSSSCFGATNDNAQFGNGSTIGGDGTITASPVQVTGLTSGTISLSSGGSHTCAAKSEGIYCWGLGTSGQLGTGINSSPTTKVFITSF